MRGRVTSANQDHQRRRRYVVFSPDGKHIAANVSGNTWRATDVRVWELASGQELFTLAGHESGIWRMSFSPDGKLLTTAGSDKVIMFWDMKALVGE